MQTDWREAFGRLLLDYVRETRSLAERKRVMRIAINAVKKTSSNE